MAGKYLMLSATGVVLGLFNYIRYKACSTSSLLQVKIIRLISYRNSGEECLEFTYIIDITGNFFMRLNPCT